MRIQLLVDRSTLGGNICCAAALSFCAVVLGVMAVATPVHAAPTYLSQSECRNGFWHVITYDISDPNHWVQLPPPDGDIPTGQPCTGSSSPGDPGSLSGKALEMQYQDRDGAGQMVIAAEAIDPETGRIPVEVALVQNDHLF